MKTALIATHLEEKERIYTGQELRPHFLLSQYGLKGNALGAFVGPCEVPTEHLVDWEDRLAQDFIRAKSMVHFIGEFFGLGLGEGVWLQRLWMSILKDYCEHSCGARGLKFSFERRGDDIMIGERKLSVSIVTASPVSILMHAGINIDASGAPVPAIGLSELGIEPRQFAKDVLSRFEKEWEDIHWACTKVRPVI